MVLFESSGFLKLNYIPEKGYIVFAWEDFSISLAEIKKAHEAALAVAVERGCFGYIADCSRARDSLLPEVILWWRKTWMPKLAAAGIRKIVTVESRSVLSSLSNRNWQRDEGSGIEMVNVGSLAAAEAALSSPS
jgi:hypothetical protein